MKNSNLKFAAIFALSMIGFSLLATVDAHASTETPEASAQEFANEVNGRVLKCRAQLGGVYQCAVVEYTTRGTTRLYTLRVEEKEHGGYSAHMISEVEKAY